MSRVGKQPVPVPQGVQVSVANSQVTVKGPKGQLQFGFRSDRVDVSVDGDQVVVSRHSDEKQSMALHGLTRSLIANAVVGVTEGFSKRLDVYGVGFGVDQQGRKLTMQIGFSHLVEYESPEGIEVTTENPIQGAQARIVISGIDKQQVGQAAADIREKRKPDPYKGKGIRYENEVIHWKAGKTGVVWSVADGDRMIFTKSAR